MKKYIATLLISLISISALAMDEAEVTTAEDAATVGEGTEPGVTPVEEVEPVVEPAPVEEPAQDLTFYALMCSAPSEMTPEQQAIFVSSGQIQQQRTQQQRFLMEPEAILAEARDNYPTDEQIIDFILQENGPAVEQQIQALLASPEGEGLTPDQARSQVLTPIVVQVKQQNNIPPTVEVLLSGIVQGSCGFALEFEEQLAANGCKDTESKSLDVLPGMSLCGGLSTEISQLNDVTEKITTVQQTAQEQIQQIQQTAQAEINQLVEQGDAASASIVDKITEILGGDESAEQELAPVVVNNG